jgi:hypothetical protein
VKGEEVKLSVSCNKHQVMKTHGGNGGIFLLILNSALDEDEWPAGENRKTDADTRVKPTAGLDAVEGREDSR